MTELALEHVTLDIAGARILDDVTLRLGTGCLVALLGPNGAGKTTLLRCALGLVAGYSGKVTIDGLEPSRLSATERARRVAYLPQTRPLAWPLRVRDAVALGRYAYGAVPGRLGKCDADAVSRAIAACDLQSLAGRRMDTLSGGELARAHCARAFAAEAPLVVADEPTAALDPLHQHRVLQLLRQFVDAGGGAVIVLHDAALAARYADRLIWLKDGRRVADGTPGQTLTPARMADVYGVHARVTGTDEDRLISVLGPVDTCPVVAPG